MSKLKNIKYLSLQPHLNNTRLGINPRCLCWNTMYKMEKTYK